MGLVIFGSGGSGDPTGSKTSPTSSGSNQQPVNVLTDLKSWRVAVNLSSTDHESAFAKTDTGTVTPSLFYTNGEGIKWAMSGGAAMERQLLYGAVRLVKGTQVAARALVYTLDNVPTMYFGLFNSNVSTALLSSITDGIWHKKAGAAVTSTYEYDRNGSGTPTSASASQDWALGRFQELSIEIAMDESTDGAGVVVYRRNSQIVGQVKATSGLPYDEDLYLTLLSSGNGTIALALPELSYTTKYE